MKFALLLSVCSFALVILSLLPVHAQTSWTGLLWAGTGAWVDSDVLGVVTADEDTFTMVEYAKNDAGKYRATGATMVGVYDSGTLSGTYTLPDGSWTRMDGTFANGFWVMTDSEGTQYTGSYTLLQ